jgi:hypothetical protein
VSGKPPASVRCLREKHPGPIDECRVAGGGGHDLRESRNDRELLVAVEGAGAPAHFGAGALPWSAGGTLGRRRVSRSAADR